MDQGQAKEFGAWLRQQRQAAGLTTYLLAKQTGIDRGTIVRFEQGAMAAPSPEKLARIANAIDVELADIYTMVGYAIPDSLPSYQPYLRRKYGDLPEQAIEDLDRAFAEIIRKHGYDPRGPRNGEDETPDV